MLNIVKENRRQRYIGFIVTSNYQIPTKSDFQKEIIRQCRLIFNKECKEMGIMLIRFNGSQGIIKCNHFEKEKVIILLESVKKIASQIVKIDTVATSGTIRSLTNKHMNFESKNNNHIN